jgi:hypothetical protein
VPYISSGLKDIASSSLFPTTLGKRRELGTRAMTWIDGQFSKAAIERGCYRGFNPMHSFKATSITTYLENGGTLEVV